LDLNGTVVISLLHAAQKYQLPGLLSKCEVFLSEHLDVNNACTIYSQAKFFSMANLKKGALEFIALNAMEIFNSEDFLSLSAVNLLDTLQLDSLYISEVNIFRSVLKWAESKLSQSKKLITGQSRRGIMLQSNILYMIRIPLLTLEEYTTVVVPSDVLTDEEQLFVFKAITMKINSVSKITTGFSMCSRKCSNIINLSVDAMLFLCVDLPYQGDVVLASPFRGGGDVFGNYRNGKKDEIMYIKASAAVRIVSAIIKPRYRDQLQCSFIRRITCIVDEKEFEGVYEHDKSPELEINHDILPNETLQLHFEVGYSDEDTFTQAHHPIAMISSNVNKGNKKKRGEHQFSDITKLEHVNISLDVEGVHLVDSLNIMALY
jgi:hypothetical protein